ncbi:MAG: tRNA 2-thiouridine(34) synthase MnmA [Gammaproteobacteria bacterium]|nr:tRNA 2-thiouridine(34) synthase MnmA [Gammaproteobacteria bacterium]MYJ52244.1 tRNA 2-thiouridine(34) synthase MnmA [Gammaproteobacteria bacterium]
MSKIMVGLSGGVDSSVAASRLLEAGHRVTGLFMKNWEEDDTPDHCTAAEDLEDAQEICKLLGIELKTINFSHEYWDRVFRIFLHEYRSGRTPNPDIVCNREIKFKEFLEWAVGLGADCIATGHYARLEKENGHYNLLKGLDRNKDQSYFLYALDQQALGRVHFPVGDMTKDAVRARARELSLPVHDKKDSTGICFIGEKRFADFLKRYLPSEPGEILTLDGETVGRHQGAWYYTIGQRQGLGIGGGGEPWYVARKDVRRNVIYAVQGKDHPALLKTRLVAEQLNWIRGIPPDAPLDCTAKTRYRQPDQRCAISGIVPGCAEVAFESPQWGVAAGQSIVFYHDDICIGGGVIRHAYNQRDNP